jgi:restriction endonuclease S subunit
MKYKKYPSYKDSGVEWLGEIPTEWVDSKLKYYLDKLIAGGTPKTDNFDFWSESKEGMPWVSIADMTKNDLIVETKKNVTFKGIVEKNLKILPKGTLLYSIFASIGKVAIANVELTTNQAILGLVPNYKMNKSYLYWLLIGLENYVKFSANSNTQDNLNSEKVANFPIAVPFLDEQQQIAKFLDNATQKMDTLIQKQENLIKLLKEKRQAVISHAVTKGINPNVKMKDSGVEWLGNIPEHWDICKLKHNLRLINQKVVIKEHKVIALENIESWSGKYIQTDSKYTGEDVAFTTGDVLFGKLRPYLAKVFECNFSGVAFGDLLVFRPNKNINTKYSYYYMISEDFIKIVDSSTYGAKMPRASADFIQNMAMPILLLEEQQQIASYLDDKTSKMDKLIEKANKSIELLKEKRTALISAAVTGKIDVREML